MVMKCCACGEVIGVYEPIVAVVEGKGHLTSRAASPEICVRAECYHPDCWTAASNARPLARRGALRPNAPSPTT
jgi:hypothetical protein